VPKPLGPGREYAEFFYTEILRHPPDYTVMRAIKPVLTEAGTVKTEAIEDAKVTDVSHFLAFCEKYNGEANVYCGMNAFKQIGRKDSSVKRLTLITFDLDTIRDEPRKYPATEEEVEAGLEKIQDVAAYLTKEWDLGRYIIAMSGNGWHLHIPINVPVEEADPDKYKAFQQKVSEHFPDYKLDDMSALSHPIKVPGTWSQKPCPTDERPNRMSTLSAGDIEKWDCQSETPNFALVQKINNIEIEYTVTEETAGKDKTPRDKTKNALQKMIDRMPKIYKDFRETGKPEGFKSRSEAEFGFIIELIRRNVNKKQIREILEAIPNSKTTEEGDHYFELTYGNADLIVTHETEDLVQIAFEALENHDTYLSTDAGLYVYDRGYYRLIAPQYVHRQIERELEAMGHGEDCTGRIKKEVLGKISDIHYLEDREIEESSRDLLCLENKVLNVATRELTNHSPGKVFFSKIPVVYDPDAKCPTIDKFLREIFHEPREWENLEKGLFRDSSHKRQDPVDTFEEFVAFCLMTTKIRGILVLVGPHNSGKSTALELVRALLGEENTTSHTIQDLARSEYYRADLKEALANIRSDIPNNPITHLPIIKSLADETDSISARRAYGHPFQFHSRARLMHSANSLPPVDFSEKEFFDRVVLLECPTTFKDRPEDPDKGNPGDQYKDPYLADKLRAELSGWLNRILSKYSDLAARGHFATGEWYETAERWDHWTGENRERARIMLAERSTVAEVKAAFPEISERTLYNWEEKIKWGKRKAEAAKG